MAKPRRSGLVSPFPFWGPFGAIAAHVRVRARRSFQVDGPAGPGTLQLDVGDVAVLAARDARLVIGAGFAEVVTDEENTSP